RPGESAEVRPEGRCGALRWQRSEAFLKAWLGCPMGQAAVEAASHRGGWGPLGTHHWRTVGQVIPWRGARPQSPPPFHPANKAYHKAAPGQPSRGQATAGEDGGGREDDVAEGRTRKAASGSRRSGASGPVRNSSCPLTAKRLTSLDTPRLPWRIRS